MLDSGSHIAILCFRESIRAATAELVVDSAATAELVVDSAAAERQVVRFHSHRSIVYYLSVSCLKKMLSLRICA